MDHPKTFLLKKIIASNESFLPSLRSLNAKYVDDLVKVLTEYHSLTIREIYDRLMKGEEVDFGDGQIQLKKTKNLSRY